MQTRAEVEQLLLKSYRTEGVKPCPKCGKQTWLKFYPVIKTTITCRSSKCGFSFSIASKRKGKKPQFTMREWNKGKGKGKSNP